MTRPSAVVLGVLLCAFLPSFASGQGTTKVKKAANEISIQELADPAVSSLSVLDAVMRLRPNWMRSRGETSFGGGAKGSVMPEGGPGSVNTGTNAPGVILNEVNVTIEILRTIKATEVTSLKHLSAQDATTRYGTGFQQGAILVSTLAVKR